MSSSPQFILPSRKLTWLITGTSSGFGLSLARHALAHGHTVIATSRNPSANATLVREIESHKGSKFLPLDVTDPNSPNLIKKLEQEGVKVDVLVNNAGYSIYGPVETLTEEETRDQMESMYFGPLRLVRAVLPGMREQGYGVVVNMSSGAALEGRDSMGIYAGAKAGLDGLSKILGKELAPFNIRVLTVALGTFNTNMGNATKLGKTPLPEAYKDSVANQMMQYMESGKFAPDGDKDKAMKAVYEVVVGEGVGKGHEGERFLPLGRDLSSRIKLMKEQCEHSLEVFGEVADNVYVEKK